MDGHIVSDRTIKRRAARTVDEILAANNETSDEEITDTDSTSCSHPDPMLEQDLVDIIQMCLKMLVLMGM